MKKLVDQTLEQMSIMYPNRFPRHLVRYNEFDLDDFFNTIDIGQDGVISRTELKFFFKRLGKQEPDEFWKRKLGLRKIEKELNDKLEELKEKQSGKTKRKPDNESIMPAVSQTPRGATTERGLLSTDR